MQYTGFWMVVIRPHLSSRAARVSELLSTWCRMWGSLEWGSSKKTGAPGAPGAPFTCWNRLIPHLLDSDQFTVGFALEQRTVQYSRCVFSWFWASSLNICPAWKGWSWGGSPCYPSFMLNVDMCLSKSPFDAAAGTSREVVDVLFMFHP